MLRGWSLVHGAVAGGLFSLEFVLIYSGARYTNSGHLAIFINSAPFFVAVGAHLMLAGERLTLGRWLALTLAFLGVVLLFSDDLYLRRQGFWRGDLLVMAGALAWALTTLYMKRFMTAGMNGFQLLYAQVLVSTPVLLLTSLALEPVSWQWPSPAGWGHLLFQAEAVVFLSYLAWFNLLRRYPASALQSFTFLSPVWGVLLGVALLEERLTPPTAAGMALVGAGLVLVNRRRPEALPA